jgi:DNA-binding NarL/FixJ family response regulator
MNSIKSRPLLLIDEDPAGRDLIRAIVQLCRDDRPVVTDADSFAAGVWFLRGQAAAVILLGQTAQSRPALLQLVELRSLAGKTPIIPYRPYLTRSVIAETLEIGPEAVAGQDRLEGLRQLIRATRDPRVLAQPALAAVAAPHPSLRQARLKPECAALYPSLQPSCWVPASVVAQHLLGRALEMPNPDPVLLRRLMIDEHFEFQGGDRRAKLPEPGTRLGDV